MSSFEFFVLDKTFDRSAFDCGVEELNRFLQARARQNQKAGFNRTFVAAKVGDSDRRVLGFYTLSMGEIDLSALPLEIRKKLPKHPVPVARVGRLAVDLSVRGQGLGKFLLVDAIKRVQAASLAVGVYALLVDAKDDSGRSFYKQFGFLELFDEPMSLFSPLASVQKGSK